jgi:F plasmid transfer operon protein TraF
MGMGGAGVARDMGAYASYWNPAGLAFATKTFSTTIGAGVGLKVSEGLADNVDRLSKFTEGNPSVLDSLKNLNVTSANPKAIADMVSLLSVINDIQTKKGTLSLNMDAAAGFQIKQFGTGLFMLSEGYGRPLADLENVLPSTTSVGNGNPITSANLVTLAGTSSPTTTFFDFTQKAQIDAALRDQARIASAAERTNVINAIGNNLGSPSANSTQLTSAQATETIVNVVAPAFGSPKSINLNSTAVMVKNIIYTEVPISYGHAIDFGAYGKLGVGGSFKVVNGRVYQTRIKLTTDNGESVTSSDITDGFKDNYEQSTNVTFDLGTQWKYSEWLTVGLVAKNLTSPAFKSPELKDQKGRLVDANGNLLLVGIHEGDVKLKPQVRLGVAVTPLSWLTLASDIDLTANESILSGLDFTNRHFGGGLELSPFEWFKFRGGMYENLANSEIGPVATAGLTLGIPWVLFEIDAAYGLKTAKYKDSSYPREARLQAQLAVQF